MAPSCDFGFSGGAIFPLTIRKLVTAAATFRRSAKSGPAASSVAGSLASSTSFFNSFSVSSRRVGPSSFFAMRHCLQGGVP